MHGPAPSNFSAPRYTKPILLVDSVAHTFPAWKRAIWRRSRDKAVERWQVAVPLWLEEDPWPEDWYPDLSDQYIPSAIHLLRGKKEGTIWFDVCYYNGSSDSSVVVTTPLGSYWRRGEWRSWAGIIGHELGHGLGLAHGGGGIMSGAWRPNFHDLSSIQAYYL